MLVCLVIRDQDHIKPIPTSPLCRSEITNKNPTRKNGQVGTSHHGVHHGHKMRSRMAMGIKTRPSLNREGHTKTPDGLELATTRLGETEWIIEI